MIKSKFIHILILISSLLLSEESKWATTTFEYYWAAATPVEESDIKRMLSNRERTERGRREKSCSRTRSVSHASETLES